MAAWPPGPRSEQLLARDGTELLELGGLKNGVTTTDGAAFDPVTGRWRRIDGPGPGCAPQGSPYEPAAGR